MTSTSKNGFLSSYRDRIGIALMEFHIHAGIRCIDVGVALPHYAKPEEAELLLPPFTELTIRESAPSGDELLITDSEGVPPKVSGIVTVGDISPFSGNIPVLPPEGNAAGMRIYEALNAGKAPESGDIAEYSQWKRALQQVLHYMLIK